MNAKKITSLVLAAVMAAGTSTVAFADVDPKHPERPLDFFENDIEIYTENDGVLEERDLESDPVAPGDTIYIRLDELENGTYTNVDGDKVKVETKDKTRYNVYADWKVGGDQVEDMEVVYKKGNFFDSSIGNNSGYIYALDFDTALDTYDGTPVYVDGSKVKNVAQVEAYLKENPEDIEKFVKAEFTKNGGYILNQKYYPTDAAAMATVTGYTGGKSVYRVNGVVSTNMPTLLAAAGFESATNYGTLYVDNSTEWNQGYGTATTTPDSTHQTAISNPADVEVLYNGSDFTFVRTNYSVTMWDLFTGDVIEGLDHTSNAYADASGKLYWDAEAVLTNEKAFAVTTSYDVNGTAFANLDDAVAYVIGQIVDVDITNATPIGKDDGYTYWVKIDTKEDKTTKLLDLAGTLYVGTSKSKAEDGTAFDLDTTMSNRTTPYNVVDEITIEANSNGAVKFDKEAEDVVIYFGDNEAAWYEFDARGQSALNFEWNMDFNREIADLFPKANIDFISWVAEPSTNRTGDLWITADADTFIYEVTEDGVKEIANAEYDEDEEAWHIRTRKLTAYAISDRELDTSITLDGEDNTSSSNTSNNGGKDNPDTGR